MRIILLLFGYHQKGNVLSNEAVFDIYFNSDSLYIDSYFGLPNGTFNKDEHVIVCKLPIDVPNFKPNYLDVKMGIDSIDCNSEYSGKAYFKFDNAELKKKECVLLIIAKDEGGIIEKEKQTMRTFNEWGTSSKRILARKTIEIPYKKKKINRLVISWRGVYEYCR
ncbi:hypothetical protein [Pseudopedobacter beijingensis]|uniref:Immunity protein 50 n=1 Tax=Pseudopedobacter beijingensis TaxID=1207056 RepID=A0ABW4IFB5_9SPHI